jgi:hypothetical protein
MLIDLLDDSRVFIDLHATGLLRALAHSPTLVARPERFSVDVGAGQFEAAVEATFGVDGIAPPADLSASDREKMRENLAGSEGLDARRYPTIDLRGRYVGTTDQGTLSGDLFVRGLARPIVTTLRASREGDALVVVGAWHGRLTDLGVKPFKALLGAIKLEDRIGIRLNLRFSPPGGARGPTGP